MNEYLESPTTGKSGEGSSSIRSRVSTLVVCLSKREVDVARGVARGASNKEIAAELGISPYTVRDHVSSLLSKLGVRSRGRLAVVLSSVTSIGGGQSR